MPHRCRLTAHTTSGSPAGGGWGRPRSREACRPHRQDEAQQQVDTGLRQLGPDLDLLQQRTREHQRLADPVGLVDDTQSVRVAVGDEDMEGEGGFAYRVRLASIKLLSSPPHAAKVLWLAKQMPHRTP